MMFYDVVIAVDGYAESTMRPAPKSHKARRRLVSRQFPHLLEYYVYPQSESMAARYYDGYALNEKRRLESLQCYEKIQKSMPVR